MIYQITKLLSVFCLTLVSVVSTNAQGPKITIEASLSKIYCSSTDDLMGIGKDGKVYYYTKKKKWLNMAKLAPTKTNASTSRATSSIPIYSTTKLKKATSLAFVHARSYAVLYEDQSVVAFFGNTAGTDAGKAIAITGGLDKKIYKIDAEDQSIQYYNGGLSFSTGLNKWVMFASQPPEKPVSIAVSKSGNPWITTSENKIYRHLKGKWYQVSSLSSQIVIGQNNSVYKFATKPTIGGYAIERYKFKEKSWSKLDGLHNSFSIGTGTDYYTVDKTGNVIRHMPLIVYKMTVAKRAEATTNGVNIKILDPKDEDIKSYSEKNGAPESGPDFDCSIKHIDEKLTSPENILLDPTTDVIWPGSIIDGKTIPNGKYVSLNYPRKPFVISTSAKGAGKVSATIKSTKQSEVRKAINSIITSIPKSSLSGKLSFQAEEMYSEEQFRLKFGGSYNAGAVKIANELSIGNTTKKHKLVVEFVQEFFSIDMDDIGSYQQWINDPSKVNLTNNLPMYVASVKYGRRAYLSIESDESVSSLKNVFSGRYGPGEMKISAEDLSIIKNSKIKVYIVGGDGNNAAGAASGDYEAFKRYISKGIGTAATAMPLAYKMRFLEDKSVARVALSSMYTVRNCQAYQLKYKVTITKLVCTGVDDAGNNEEFYGMAWANFYDKNGVHLNSQDNKIWHRKVNQYVSLRHGGTLNINETKLFSYKKEQVKKNKTNDPGAYLILKGWIEEDDDSNGNDDLGRKEKKIFLNELTDPVTIIKMDGFADGGSKAVLFFKIETY